MPCDLATQSRYVDTACLSGPRKILCFGAETEVRWNTRDKREVFTAVITGCIRGRILGNLPRQTAGAHQRKRKKNADLMQYGKNRYSLDAHCNG